MRSLVRTLFLWLLLPTLAAYLAYFGWANTPEQYQHPFHHASPQGAASPTTTTPPTPAATSFATPAATPFATPAASPEMATPDANATEARTALGQAFLDAYADPHRLSQNGSGQLKPAEAGQVSIHYAPSSERDALVQVEFVNPNDASSWDYGVILRQSQDGDKGVQLRLYVDSHRQWHLLAFRYSISMQGPPDTIPLASGEVPWLDTEPNGLNEMQLVMRGDLGYLFVDGSYVATLDFSSVPTAGCLGVATEFTLEDRLGGNPLNYYDFKVWDLSA